MYIVTVSKVFIMEDFKLLQELLATNVHPSLKNGEFAIR